jgi:hypothetical protein
MNKFSIITPTKRHWYYGYGFFSNYRICLEELIGHHESGNTEIPYISWANTLWVESINPWEDKVAPSDTNPFDFWFDQPIITSDDTSTLNNYSPSSYGTIIDHAQNYFDNPTELKRQQTIDKLYIKPKQYILDRIDSIYKKEFEGHTVLALMARGTENILHHPQYGTFGVQDYINAVSKVLGEHKEINKLFIVSEDMGWVDTISKSFPDSYFMPDVFRRTDETMEYMNKIPMWPNVSTKRENQSKLLGEETIIQIKLMGKCNYLVGKHGGLLAGAALWNENIKKAIVM